ncbi:MAG: hypothetical protein ACK5QT_08650 [Oligoflexia bacterium]
MATQKTRQKLNETPRQASQKVSQRASGEVMGCLNEAFARGMVRTEVEHIDEVRKMLRRK